VNGDQIRRVNKNERRLLDLTGSRGKQIREVSKGPEEIIEMNDIAEIETTDQPIKASYEEKELPTTICLEVQIDEHICQWLNNTHHGLKISQAELVEKALTHFLPDYFKPDTMKQNS